MRFFYGCKLAPALLAFVACCHLSFICGANEGLFSQINQNPIRFEPIPQNAPSLVTPQSFATRAVDTAGSTLGSASSFGGAAAQTSGDVPSIIAENVLQFGHNLGLQLSQLNPNAVRNEIFSPLSVMSALSLLTLGARGRSYQELKSLLGIDLSPELANNPAKYHEEFGAMLNDVQHFDPNNANNLRPQRKHAKWRDTVMKANPRNVARKSNAVDHTINVANAVFVQNGYSLNPSYSQIVKSVYESEITLLDFVRRSGEARDYINNWVSRRTHGKIPSIIKDEVDKSTNVIMASVLYFKGFWETPFFPRSTVEDNFYPDGMQGTPVRVRMMATGGVFPYYDAKEYDCRIIGLPYHGNETTMYVIQPNDSSHQKLRLLQSMLNAQKINEMIDNMAWKTTIMVFPKMHLTRLMNMKTMLQNMGVRDVFERGYSDLTLIGGTPRAVVPVPMALLAEERLQDVFDQGTNPSPTDRPQQQQFTDRFNEPALVFKSRFGEDYTEDSTYNDTIAADSVTVESQSITVTEKSRRISKRQVSTNAARARNAEALANLEAARRSDGAMKTDLFVGDILHEVDFNVDEYGTEAAAATLSYLLRSGTDVIFRGDTPFLVVIRHDPTKLPLFYGIINKPEL